MKNVTTRPWFEICLLIMAVLSVGALGFYSTTTPDEMTELKFRAAVFWKHLDVKSGYKSSGWSYKREDVIPSATKPAITDERDD